MPLLLFVVGNFSDGASRRLAKCLSWLFCLFSRSGMKLIRSNLKVAFPEMDKKSISSMSRKVVFNSVWNWIDFIRLIRHPERVMSFVNGVDMPERIEEPVMLCLPHLGSWELLAQAIPFSMKGPCAAVASIFPYAKLNDILTRSRSANGLSIIPREGAVRGVLRALGEGVNVGILIDQNLSPRHGGVFVDFFGLPVPTSPLPAMAALRRKVTLLNSTCIREENGKFRIICEVLSPPALGEDQRDITQRIIEANERLIRRWPEQYTWMYKCWFYTPTDLEPERAARLPFYAKPPKYPSRRQ